MLRLAHRLLTQPIYYRFQEPIDVSLLKLIQKSLHEQTTSIIIADDVARFVDSGDVASGYRRVQGMCIKPPFPTCLIEWNWPRETAQSYIQAGTFITSIPTDDATIIERQLGARPVDRDASANTGPAHDLLVMSTFFVERNGAKVHFFQNRMLVWLTTEGFFCDDGFLHPAEMSKDEYQEHRQGLRGFSITALVTLGLLHCRNVQKVDVTSDEGPPAKWCRRQRVPELKYHALQIDPNLGVKPRAGERKTEGDRSDKALHICRGHFAHFRDDGVSQGLFGRRQFGTFWIPAHTRGSLEHGKIISTYNVKTPA